MKIRRSISEPIRSNISWDEAWAGPDAGLIAAWERGREKSKESPALAAQALEGQLVSMPWKGGVERTTEPKRKPKSKPKYGSLLYLAMWQGLRGDDLSVDTDAEPLLTCSLTGGRVIFTGDYAKYSGA